MKHESEGALIEVGGGGSRVAPPHPPSQPPCPGDPGRCAFEPRVLQILIPPSSLFSLGGPMQGGVGLGRSTSLAGFMLWQKPRR